MGKGILDGRYRLQPMRVIPGTPRTVLKTEAFVIFDGSSLGFCLEDRL